jgi:hypothetical protein
MYVSFAYEPMTQLATEDASNPNGNNTINPHGLNMREPVKGTIARGQLEFATYNVVKSNESYEKATSWANPFA